VGEEDDSADGGTPGRRKIARVEEEEGTREEEDGTDRGMPGRRNTTRGRKKMARGRKKTAWMEGHRGGGRCHGGGRRRRGRRDAREEEDDAGETDNGSGGGAGFRQPFGVQRATSKKITKWGRDRVYMGKY
jgi:hypothetical protein